MYYINLFLVIRTYFIFSRIHKDLIPNNHLLGCHATIACAAQGQNNDEMSLYQLENRSFASPALEFCFSIVDSPRKKLQEKCPQISSGANIF